MKEEQHNISVEQTTEPKNAEYYRTVLSHIPDTPGALRKTLSGKTVQKYMQIITSPQAIEADIFSNTGELTHEQIQQYKKVTGNYDACNQELLDLSLEIYDQYKDELLRLVENDARGQKKEGITNVFRSIISLHALRLTHLEGCIVDDQIGERFVTQTLALLGADLIDMLSDSAVNEQSKRVIKQLIVDHDKLFHDILGVQFYGIQYHAERKNDRKAFGKKENSDTFDRMIGYDEHMDSEKVSHMREQNQQLFVHIKNESVYKKIPQITLNESGPQVIIAHEDDKTEFAYGDFCAVRINFADEQIAFPEFKEDKRGYTYCDYGIVRDIVNCNINPESGDLCFITSNISLEQVIPEDRYVLLQNYLFQKIADYLDAKDPDIEDLFIYSQKDLEQRAQQRNVQNGEDDAIHAHDDGNNDDIVWEYIPYEKSSSEQHVEREDQFMIPKHFRTVIMDKISNAKSDEILAALRRMMGKEERVTGDHLFFRSDRTGQILPVPLHSRKEKGHIAFKLILSNLKYWGYEPMELAVELGVHVPERIMYTKT